MNETTLSSGLRKRGGFEGASGLPLRVRRACMRYVQNRDAADDLAQEVLIKVFRGGGLTREAAHEEAWLIRVTANHCLDHLRREKRERLARAAYVRHQGLEPPGEDAAKEDGEVLERLRERLDASDRKLLHLRFDLGLTQRGIAEILGVTRVRVGQRLAGIVRVGARAARAIG